jgi:hypothetical protein
MALSKRQIVKWFQVVMALATLAFLIFCYLSLDKNNNWIGLFLAAIPDAIIALVAIVIVYFIFYRPGLTDSQLNEESSSEEIARLVADKISSKQIYAFIDGEAEALNALTVATKKAKREIRATRFFPTPLRSRFPEYAEAIRERVLGLNDTKPLEHYFRVVAVNNEQKLEDVLEYITNFCGKSFILYLVNYSNDFELVIIDEDEAFVHFYGENQIISSTLHLQGKEIARKFAAIFRRLHEPAHGREILKIDCKYLSATTMEKEQKEVKEFFARHLAIREQRKALVATAVAVAK